MTSRARVAVPSSPYRGLTPFEDSELDALFFFGRARETELITANLIASRLTVLYGPSGVGKSSILRAGVARALRELPEAPRVIVFDDWTSGAELPFAEAIAAAESGRDVYLIFDQLEEAFLYDANGDVFASGLGDLVARRELRVQVALGIRDDALAQLDALKAHVPSLFGNYLRLDPLDRVAGRAALEAPIARWNELTDDARRMEIEPGLADAVLDEVTAGRVELGGGGRGRVADASRSARIETPYLQLVMQRLWDVERVADSNVLRIDTLRELGGASAIVQEHLEGALSALTAPQKNAAARMFDHLVTPSGTKIAHGVDDLAQYAHATREELAPVLRTLAESRILRPVAGEAAAAGGAFEIFHDVLADAVLEWRTRFEAQREAARAHEEADVQRRRALAVAALALGALVIVAAIAIFALFERRDARTQARQARANGLSAQALLLQAEDPQRSLERAVDAAHLDATEQTEDVLRSSLLAARLRRTLPLRSSVRTVTYVPGGNVAAGTEDGRLVLWSPGRGAARSIRLGGPAAVVAYDRSRNRLLTVGGGEATVRAARTGLQIARIRAARTVDAVFSRDGREVVSAGSDGVRISDSDSGRLVRRLRGSRFDTHVAAGAAGSRIATIAGGTDGHVTPWLYDSRTGRLVRRLPQLGAKALAFSPDGRLLATGSADGTTSIWVARTGARAALLDDGGTEIRTLAFSPDGAYLATGSSDGGVRVWRLSGGDRFFFFVGHSSPVTYVAFSPDGIYVVSTSEDRTARIWAVGGLQSGRLVALLAGSGDAVTTAAYAPGGGTLVTGGDDGVVRAWNSRIDQRLRVAAQERAPVSRAAFGRDGRTVVDVAGGAVHTHRATGSNGSFPVVGSTVALGPGGLVASAAGRTVTVREARRGGRLARFHLPDAVTALAFRADARELVAATRGGMVGVWDLGSRRRMHAFAAQKRVAVVALAPAGDTVLTAAEDSLARLWSSAGRPLRVLRGHLFPITDARFDPTGARVVTASSGSKRNVIVWNTATGAQENVLIGHFGTVTAASFSADGRWVLTAGPVAAGVWNVERGTLLFLLHGATDLLTDAEWSPSGYRVITAERDGSVRTYRCGVCVPLRDLFALARSRLALAR